MRGAAVGQITPVQPSAAGKKSVANPCCSHRLVANWRDGRRPTLQVRRTRKSRRAYASGVGTFSPIQCAANPVRQSLAHRRQVRDFTIQVVARDDDHGADSPSPFARRSQRRLSHVHSRPSEDDAIAAVVALGTDDVQRRRRLDRVDLRRGRRLRVPVAHQTPERQMSQSLLHVRSQSPPSS